MAHRYPTAGQGLTPSFTHQFPPGWARNTINTSIFRGAGLVTAEGFQFGAYYESETQILLFRRTLATNAVEIHRLPSEAALNDAHNIISLGVDGDGYLHLAFEQHGSALNYRRASAPLAIDAWSEPVAMTGQNEDRVTYPYFVTATRPGQPLLFFYRNGSAMKADVHLKRYDSAAKKWEDGEAPILAGSDLRPWSAGPYLNHPALDARGHLHLFFTWRTHHVGADLVNNRNLDYARSEDWGKTWLASNGQAFRLPITPVTSETALATAPGSNLINQCGAGVSKDGRPFAVCYLNDINGIPQYGVVWHDGRSWLNQQLLRQHAAFNLLGRGTLRLPMSRPDVVVDGDDTAWLIFRSQSTRNQMVAVPLRGPKYRADPKLLRSLWDHDLGYCEPVIDRARWSRDGVLSMLLQRSDQGDQEGVGKLAQADVYVVDWTLHEPAPSPQSE
jgi:hypothetical protein